MRIARVVLSLVAAVVIVGCSTTRYAEKTIYVSSKLVSNAGNSLRPQFSPIQTCSSSCLEIRNEPTGVPYLLFQNSIGGFIFTTGHAYKLRVQVRTEYSSSSYYENVPVETWTLLETLEKTPVSN
jgi:Domain of unknown function (DUF4377)